MHVTWYFDFISPFAWLQLRKVLALRERMAVQPVPILFAAVLDKLGQLGPAEIPGKRDFTYRYVHWQAQRQGLPLRFPPAHPFNPLPVLRLCVAAGNSWEAVEKIFVHIWQEGKAADSVDALRDLGRQLGLDDLDTALGSDAVKQAVRANTDAALAAGVFGVPTLRLDEQLFWGDDATGMALDYLADPNCFNAGEYARISTLPQAVQRRR
ncbi:2-hydroxychromene-2-carboxylate isomerase [Tahibacter aquaticus]|uniref:2-hydroxychromene-2-carboxylate isomerase n=1 Tax=Tahibacter aquaticus TaxID=520092 RepID=A0A4R6ZAN5_9GAMM|nr:2-hydroxychromene-2-carboxylate isomerase [Tahibacter aquaticus]TDR48902.1 2-hydroxychromene-2-carboxylate isomerase [Tahibacter aquaticus]